jgi:hypothetical protein
MIWQEVKIVVTYRINAGRGECQRRSAMCVNTVTRTLLVNTVSRNK